MDTKDSMTPKERLDHRIERLKKFLETNAPDIILTEACLMVMESYYLSYGVRKVHPERMNRILKMFEVLSTDEIERIGREVDQDMKDYPVV